jgi:Zn-dependent peptidase ImmA (M78 family)/predicted secreted protein
MALSWPQLHLAAAREAMRAHRELGIDTSRRIDPFEALSRSGIVVLRRRLDRMAGLYIPGDPRTGRPDGVLINAAHPPSKQRYTAAHELAHHRRDRRAVLDKDTEWLGRGGEESEQERFAEAFAAWFLMPKDLVQRTLDRLELMPTSLDAGGAYALSLELGTSYRATVNHLGDIRLIGSAQRQHLLGVSPQTVKQSLGASDVAADAWKDIWLIGSSLNLHQIHPMEGDALVLALPEIPSSGYLWQAAELPSWLELVRDEYRVAPEEFVGGHGEHRFFIRVGGRGYQRVRFSMSRPWQPDAVAESFQLDIVAQPQPDPGEVQPEFLAAAGAP